MLEMTGKICPMISKPGNLFPCQKEKCAWWTPRGCSAASLAFSMERLHKVLLGLTEPDLGKGSFLRIMKTDQDRFEAQKRERKRQAEIREEIRKWDEKRKLLEESR